MGSTVMAYIKKLEEVVTKMEATGVVAAMPLVMDGDIRVINEVKATICSSVPQR